GGGGRYGGVGGGGGGGATPPPPLRRVGGPLARPLTLHRRASDSSSPALPRGLESASRGRADPRTVSRALARPPYAPKPARPASRSTAGTAAIRGPFDQPSPA